MAMVTRKNGAGWLWRSRTLAVAAALIMLLAGVACGRTTPWLTSSKGQNAGGAGGSAGPGGSGGQGGNGGQTSNGGGGTVTTCVLDIDCDDGDFCTTDHCNDGQCDFLAKDADEDGFIDEACGGEDCNDLNPNTNPFAPEVCTDGDDNDCNGVADCSDPACEFAPLCGCTPAPGGENCSNGLDDDCDTTVDCNDADCIGTPACGCTNNEVGLCGDGIDNDCDSLIDCGDGDCSGSTICQCQAMVEVCNNGQDEDCDLLIDCADPNCNGSAACSCVPPGTPEQCSDNNDNDCDTLVDCADPDCAASPACQMCMPEVCDDGIDNDCDNLIDCADDACSFAPNCAPTQELCNNSLDDDNDGFIDCDDPDCANNPLCVIQQSNCLTAAFIPGTGQFTGNTTGNVGEFAGQCGGGAGEAIFFFTLTQPSRVHLDTIGTSFDSVLYVRKGSCKFGQEIACDDDSGGFQWSALLDFTILNPGTYYVFVDGFTIDPNQGANEGPYILNVEIEPNPPELCGDGLDNDGDQHIDCADSDCTTVGACLNCNGGNAPGPEFGIGACTDGQDNDCDGQVDCADDDCSASPYALTECCNGMDQNDNGIADDFSCRCASNADCGGNQICYTHTTFTCGLPCTQFFGEVCPAVALGSFCNTTTQQCEF